MLEHADVETNSNTHVRDVASPAHGSVKVLARQDLKEIEEWYIRLRMTGKVDLGNMTLVGMAPALTFCPVDLLLPVHCDCDVAEAPRWIQRDEENHTYLIPVIDLEGRHIEGRRIAQAFNSRWEVKERRFEVGKDELKEMKKLGYSEVQPDGDSVSPGCIMMARQGLQLKGGKF